MIIFEKTYDGESIPDIERDVYEALDSDFNDVILKIPTDKYGIQQGKFKVTISWDMIE